MSEASKEMITMAERIAFDQTGWDCSGEYETAKSAALTAIMEVSEKTASFLEGKAARNEETAGWTDSLSVKKNSKRDARKRRADAQAIRNGEHLR